MSLPCLESLDRSPPYIVREKVCQPCHIKRVSDDDPFKAKLFFEQVSNDRRRNRRDMVRDLNRAPAQSRARP
jgi:hypothetical protein